MVKQPEKHLVLKLRLLLLRIPKCEILKRFIIQLNVNWGKPERAPSLARSTVALSVWYVGPFGPRWKVFV